MLYSFMPVIDASFIFFFFQGSVRLANSHISNFFLYFPLKINVIYSFSFDLLFSLFVKMKLLKVGT